MSGLPGYFVAPDSEGDDLWLWKEHGNYPLPVLSQRMLLDDPDVWDFLVVATKEAS